MDESGIVVDGSSEVAELAISAALGILRDPRLSGPDRQFQNAVLDIRRRPNPDFECAVSKAANSVEGLTRILLNDTMFMHRAAVKQLSEKFGLHSRIRASMEATFEYASDEGGRHGLVGNPRVDSHIAEFCVHQSAAAIVLIARLHGIGVVEGAERFQPQDEGGA
jgi:hypothetical protein